MRRSRKWNATLETAQRGEVKQLCNETDRLTSPSRRTLEVAFRYLIRRDNPSSKEGLKIHHQFRFISNH